MTRSTILTIISILIYSIGFSQEIDFYVNPQIRTRATYTTEVLPDKITLSITLTERNTRDKVSVEELENRLETVLTSNNIDINYQLKLINLSSNFRNSFIKHTDIHKTKRYELILTNANLTGKILRDLETNNISNVKLIRTEYSKLEELKVELKSKAVLKAKKQAEQMAASLNQSLGKAIFISDFEANTSNIIKGQITGTNTGIYEEMKSKLKEDDLDIEFDYIKVDASVTVYFKLE